MFYFYGKAGQRERERRIRVRALLSYEEEKMSRPLRS